PSLFPSTPADTFTPAFPHDCMTGCDPSTGPGTAMHAPRRCDHIRCTKYPSTRTPGDFQAQMSPISESESSYQAGSSTSGSVTASAISCDAMPVRKSNALSNLDASGAPDTSRITA